jgi:glyoxylase-like metal-dependent hydrolase (beta-lactamase superfamily II)
MSLNRRHWMIATGSLAAGSLLPACSTSPSASDTMASGYYHHRVGHARVTAVSDGIGKRPLDAGFVKNAPLAQVQQALQAAGLPTTHIDVPYTCFVVELDGKRYLLDTGFGDSGAPGSGLLHTHMRAAGIDPASIDVVIISHMHGDHINGLRRKDGSLIYPRAVVYVPQPEAAFWMDDARMNATPEAARGGFMAVRRVFNQYPTAQLKFFTPGATLFPGIHTIAAFGHSPGHTAIAVESGKSRFTFIADVAHYPALFVRHPDWQVQFDMNPEQARTTRHALLERLAREQDWVGGYHFPLPSLGRIQKTATGYNWVPQK